MKGNEAVVVLIGALEKLSMDYMITGSFASNVYGVPRSTKRWSALAKRPKDFKGACDVMAVQGGNLDWPYIERWCEELGASAVLAEAREIAGS